MTAITASERLGNYLEIFGELEKRTPNQPKWLRELRNEAFARFCETGFPTTKDEDWRFTNVNAISHASFSMTHPQQRLAPADLEQYRLPNAAAWQTRSPTILPLWSLISGITSSSVAMASLR